MPFVDSVTNEASSPAGPFAPVLIRVDGAEGTLEGFAVNGQAFQVVEYEGQKYLGLSPPTVFVMTGEARTEVNFVTESIVVMKEGAHVGAEYRVLVTPKLLLVGQQDVDVRVQLARVGVDFAFDAAADSFALRAQKAGEQDVPLQNVRVVGKDLVGTVANITEQMIGYKKLVLNVGGKESTVPFALRVIPKYRLLLTFDDGPSVEPFGYIGGKTPTESVLDTLQAQGIKAAFFVLTTPDKFGFTVHPKAETSKGFSLLRDEIREGHVVACHWGGLYETQGRKHWSRVAEPAYDYDASPATPDGANALDSDLRECISRIRQAYSAEGQAAYAPEFVRPPLWEFANKSRTLDARPTYASLGLKMILTDGKLGDGGYPGAGGTFETFFLWRHVNGAMDAGYADIILTMHDSNPDTARDLAAVLNDLRLNLSNRGLAEGTHYDFTKTRDDALDVMRKKTRFHYAPAGCSG